MNRLTLASTLLLVLSCLSLSATAADEEGWISLFDGETTRGWTPRGELDSFEAIDGELRIVSQQNVWIVSDFELADFEAEAEVKIPEDADENFNSGLGYRLTGDTGKPKGYQCEIDVRMPGAIYAIGLGGWLHPKKKYDKAFELETKGLFKPEEWNTVKVRSIGKRMQTWVNGRAIADLEHDKSLSGAFGLQHYGGGGTIRFRNLRVKDLSQKTN